MKALDKSSQGTTEDAKAELKIQEKSAEMMCEPFLDEEEEAPEINFHNEFNEAFKEKTQKFS